MQGDGKRWHIDGQEDVGRWGIEKGGREGDPEKRGSGDGKRRGTRRQEKVGHSRTGKGGTQWDTGARCAVLNQSMHLAE